MAGQLAASQEGLICMSEYDDDNNNKNSVTCMSVTIDGVWIGVRIY